MARVHHLSANPTTCTCGCVTDDEHLHARVCVRAVYCMLQWAGRQGLLYRAANHGGVLIMAPLGAMITT